jgi:hypothetical protein
MSYRTRFLNAVSPIVSGVTNLILASQERIRALTSPGLQTVKAADLWSRLEDYETYYADQLGKLRSEWVATQVAHRGISSLLEVGTNSARNLAVIHVATPQVQLKGIDVNPNAIDFARAKNPAICLEVVDASRWEESEKSWDAILTMSLIDHIPNEAINKLADNLVRTCRKYVICVELWDGSEGVRGPFKYSRDLRKVFEPRGVRTLVWERAVGQYDERTSLLWAYIGEIQ